MGSYPLFGNPPWLNSLKFLLCGWSFSLEGNLPEPSGVELVIGKSPMISAMRAKRGHEASGSECRLSHFFLPLFAAWALSCVQDASCQLLELCWFTLCVLPEMTSLLSARSHTPTYALQLWNFCFLFCFCNIWNICTLTWHLAHFSKCLHMVWTSYLLGMQLAKFPSMLKNTVLSLGNVNTIFFPT